MLPSILYLEETINTLKYASKAKRISNRTKKNMRNNLAECTDNEEVYKAIVEQLSTEADRLRTELARFRPDFHRGLNRKRRYSAPNWTTSMLTASIKDDPLTLLHKYKLCNQQISSNRHDKLNLKSELAYLTDLLRTQKSISNEFENKINQELARYASDLFLIIRDSF